MSKKEYVIPGLEDVGVPGKRNVGQPKVISEVLDSYRAGNGVVIKDTGMPATQQEVPFLDPTTTSRLVNLPTSMGSPYTMPNERKDTLLPSLQKAHVVVVGLGGGAPIPVELLKAGVGEFSLYDADTLQAENLIRHPCGIEFVGQPKAEAIRIFLERQSGNAVSCKSFSENIFDSETIESSIARAQLLVVATDTESSRFYLNEISVRYGIPAVFVGMFQGGMGGEIFVSNPESGCYCCLAEFLGRKEFISAYTNTVAKESCTSSRDTQAMPGLGTDQGILCHIAARKALDVLAKSPYHSLPSLGKNWIIFSLSGIPGILPETLSSLQKDVPKNPNCSVCNPQILSK